MQEYIAHIDDNGEVVKYEPLQKNLGRNWVATFQEGALYISSLNISKGALKVYIYLVGKLDYDNWIRVKQGEVESGTGIKQSNVSRAIKELVAMDIIVQGPDSGKCKTYRMNPRIAHKGARHYTSNLVQYDELKRRKEG